MVYSVLMIDILWILLIYNKLYNKLYRRLREQLNFTIHILICRSTAHSQSSAKLCFVLLATLITFVIP